MGGEFSDARWRRWLEAKLFDVSMRGTVIVYSGGRGRNGSCARNVLGCAVVEWLAGVPAKLPIRISEIISGKADGELRMEVAVESFQ